MEDSPAAFDYPALEELDPSLVDGFKLVYEREVPFELRSAVGLDPPSEVGALEAVKVKILVQEGPQLKTIRVELSSESNLFFLYVHELSEPSFKEVQESQRLMVDFNDYPTVLMRMLNQCIREPHTVLAIFIMQPTGEARLDFIQNMEYKFVELLSCRFLAAGEELVRQHATYRYNVVKARLQLMQARLADINAAVKVKNPSLLLQLQRTPPRLPGVPPQSPNRSSTKPFYP
ncbi:hypothetical protein GPECTOR_3g211 [Gonium pectorale]|uniref:Spindle assembly abnormal protein 6 N-terminal domain-containing protein n=1 Tax=Gonium pectorale TaxID=33097 RepID=A0A150GZ83_GONPE|nr:hypothetical protein GPECTOR_3g211 [Gonium pectorale]|eukprot:KXZ55053.1 hypothetical protein GPECTOR_3g211 [Gonium pectorale]